MSSSLTLGEARAALSDIIFGDSDSDRFNAVINDAVSRIYSAGRWEDLTGIVEFENPSGYITLPRRYSSIIGAQMGGRPRSTFSRYLEYSLAGPGDMYTDRNLNLVVDQGNVATQFELPEPSILTWQAPIGEDILANLSCRVFGIDSTGNTIFDQDGAPGVSIPNGTYSTAIFAEITGVSKPITVGFSVLTSEIGGVTPFNLARFEPNETSPTYRRYKVGTENDRTLRCLCKRRFVPLYNESDLVYPAHIGALKMAMLAVTAENASLQEKAQEYWNLCFQLLDTQKREARGNAEHTPNFRPNGMGVRPLRRAT